MALLRTVTRLAVAGALVIAVLDGGSILLTTMQVPDDVRTAGHIAAAAAANKPIDRRTAVGAFEAAHAEADKHDIRVNPRTFTLQPDRRITLTGTKTAPTLMVGRFGVLRDLTIVASTVTVGELPFR